MAEEKVFEDPVDWDQLYPGRFIKAGDFQGKRPVYTISRVKLHELEGDKGKQVKGVIYFSDHEKQWALNKTNGICLKGMFGRDLKQWPGKRVQLFAGTWDGDVCIRVWGSPDIAQDMDVVVQLPRKKAITMTMHRTLTKAEREAAERAKAAAGKQQPTQSEDLDDGK